MTDGLLLSVGAYLIGGIPFGLLLCSWFKGVDIREHGSRNIGFTNALRVCGKAVGIPVLILDILKGYVPVVAAQAIVGDGGWTPILAGAAAMLGHAASPYIGFKGGKAVATGAGVFLGLQWEALSIALLTFLAVLAASRYVSLASISAVLALAVVLTVEQLFFPSWAPGIPLLLMGCAAAILVIVRHHENIRRLLNGTENKIGATKSGASE